MLDGRVLRSRSVPGLDQEAYALLATYQALTRTAADAVTTRPGLPTARRQRAKARSRKNPTSKHGPNAGEHRQTANHPDVRPFSVKIHVMEDGEDGEDGPASRRRR
ncbi:hypothetical protein ACFV6G_25725 [Streptomyces lavendulae]|uniref:hypothetical protein n=1 Tax=Streptomyces lavendulae TaxID=1914 RepID=UPI00367D323C